MRLRSMLFDAVDRDADGLHSMWDVRRQRVDSRRKHGHDITRRDATCDARLQEETLAHLVGQPFVLIANRRPRNSHKPRGD